MPISIRQRQRKQATVPVVGQGLPYPLSTSISAPIRQRLAARLDRWARGPRRLHNRHALVCMAAFGVLAVALTWSAADRGSALRLVALALFAAHLLANRLIVAGLGWMRDRGMREAGRALDVYLGPEQLTSLQIGLMWIGVAVFAPLLDLIAPAAPLAG